MQSAINIIFRLVTIVFVIFSISNSILGFTQTNLTQYITPPSVALDPAAGNPQTGDFGSVGLYNGRLNYVIPLLQTGGRGASDYTISLDINRLWKFDYTLDYYEEDGDGIYNRYTTPNSTPWWVDSLKYMPGRIIPRVKMAPQPVCAFTNETYIYEGNLSFISQDGSEINLFSQSHPSGVTIQCTSYTGNPNSPGTYTPVSLGNIFTTVDGSSIKFVADQQAWVSCCLPTSGYLYFPDGKKYRIDDSFVSWIEDLNGNRTVFDYHIHPNTQQRTTLKRIIDSNGRPTDIYYGLQDSEYGLHDKITYPGLNDQTQTIRITYGQLGDALRTGETLKNQTQLFGVLECPTGATNCPSPDLINPTVITSIVFPGNRRFQYKYNSYGELARVEAPQGAAFEYDWGGSLEGGNANGVIPDPSNSPFPDIFRQVLEKRVYSDGGSGSTYDFRTVIHKSITYYYAIYPNQTSTRTVSSFGRNNALIGAQKKIFWGHPLAPASKPDQGYSLSFEMFPNWWIGKDKETLYYGSDGITLLRRNLNQWSFETESGSYITNPRVTKQVTIAVEGSQAIISLQETEYDGTGSSDYFVNMNPKRIKNYNYKFLDLATASTASRQSIYQLFGANDVIALTAYDYAYDQSYRDRNIAGLVTEQQVLDPSNPTVVVAKTQTIYDQSQYLIADSGTLSGNAAGSWVNPNTNMRGLPTTNRVWDSDNNNWIDTHSQYDQYGNVRKVWDANGNILESEYSSTYNYAYPTKVITPAPDPTGTHGTNQTSQLTTTYDFMTGLPLTVTNDFGQITATEYDDNLRPKRVYSVNYIAPEIQTVYGVPDSNGQLPANQRFVKVRKQIDANNWDEGITWFDALGKTYKTQATDSQGDVIVESQYDNFGRVKATSQPYRAGATKLWSVPRYDEMNRAVEAFTAVTDSEINNPPAGKSTGVTSFGISNVSGLIGTYTVTTDASGRKRRSVTNSLGQLLRVDEPTSTGGTIDADLGTLANPHQPTYYTYNIKGNMVKVQQENQYRYFKYDSLGRLIRVKQPEQEVNADLNLADSFNTSGQWTAAYKYDGIGNLIRTTDATGVNIINEYDRAGRVTKRCYSDPNLWLPSAVNCGGITGGNISDTTPEVKYYYDGKGLIALQTPNYAKGKLTVVTSSISETRYKLFDNFGRLTEMEQRTPVGTETLIQATPRVSKYFYDFGGRLVKEEYPSGRVVENEFEADGDLMRIFGKANTNAAEKTYATGFSYTPEGRIQRLQLGNGLWESAKFNTRLQATEFSLGHSNGDGSLWKLNYDYGELNTDGTTVDTGKNTGNIAKQTLSFNGLANPFVQTFKYDSLYRLVESRETSNSQQTWKQEFGYDRYGNRLTHNKFIGSTQLTLDNKTHPTINAATNRFNTNQGYNYDKTGNLTQDAEGRGFTFNGENKQTVVMNGTTKVGEYFYDGEGKRVKKKVYDAVGVIKEETVFVYSAGKLIAEYSTKPPPQNPTTNYTMTDNLGSPRVITNSLGEVVSRRDFMPFGEDLMPDGATRTTGLKYSYGDDIRQKFTGYQKDEETQLDFAEARMYENRHARFTAVDPLLTSGKSSNPQTFNRYVYVVNNPLKYIDPTGLQLTECMDCTVYTNNKGGFTTNSGVKGTTPYNGDQFTSDFDDGNRWIIGKTLALNVGNTVKLNQRAESFARSQLLQFDPLPFNPQKDGYLPQNPFSDFATDSNRFIRNLAHRASLAVWNGAARLAPDYGKFSFTIPLIADAEGAIDREFRLFGGVSSPFFTYGSRLNGNSFNQVDSARPRSFGFRMPSLALGWFTNIGNDPKDILGAMNGGNVSATTPILPPFTIGVSKSLPDEQGFLTTPTAFEIGVGGPGVGVSYSSQIPCSPCDDVRNNLRNWRGNPNNIQP